MLSLCSWHSQMQTPHCAHLHRTPQSLDGWALVRAPGWSHTSWLALSSALCCWWCGRSQSLWAFKRPHTQSPGCCSETAPAPLCALLQVLQIWLHLFWAGLVTRLPKQLLCQCAGMHPQGQQGQLLSSSLSVLHGDDPQLLGKNCYNPVVAGELQAWPQRSQLSSMAGKHMSPQKHQHLAPGHNFASKCFVLIFHTGQNNKAREPPTPYRKETLVNSRKSAFYQINLILCFKVKSMLFVFYCY